MLDKVLLSEYYSDLGQFTIVFEFAYVELIVADFFLGVSPFNLDRPRINTCFLLSLLGVVFLD